MEGSARVAADACSKPVINGGDGANQHPTQTLIDLLAIQTCQGRLNDLHIAIAGDLKFARTAHSLIGALTYYQPRLYFVSTDDLSLPDALLAALKKQGIKFSFHTSLGDVIGKIDVLYMTRLQKERNDERTRAHPCRLTLQQLDIAKPHLRILHPLPRVDEIDTAIDQTHFAYYFEQAALAVPIRMALLETILRAH
jgi:aspartate carbamoyltransferase catalytic subunit